jgi:hypothetical protein
LATKGYGQDDNIIALMLDRGADVDAQTKVMVYIFLIFGICHSASQSVNLFHTN